MEITKEIPITIVIDDKNPMKCELKCEYFRPYDDSYIDTCDYFENERIIAMKRCPACLDLFGTGEK